MQHYHDLLGQHRDLLPSCLKSIDLRMRALNTSIRRRTRYTDLSTEVKVLKTEGDAVVLPSFKPEHHRLDKNRFIINNEPRLSIINQAHTSRKISQNHLKKLKFQ